MNTSNTLADKLKKLRKIAGLTQEEVGNHISITRQGYQYYESGVREPDITRLKKLADLYHVPLIDLISENVFIRREDFVGESPVYTIQGMEMEEQLIQMFRKLSPEQKEKIFRAMDTMVRTR